MISLQYFKTEGSLIFVAIILSAICLIIMRIRKKEIDEKIVIRLFIDIITILTLSSIVIFITSNGTNIIFGQDISDLFYVLSISILYMGYISLKNIKREIFS